MNGIGGVPERLLGRDHPSFSIKEAAYLGIIVLSSGVLGALMLTRGHNWGDDFAAYILQSQAIVDGRIGEFIRRSTFTIDESWWRFGPITAPWGFPILLAPVYAIFGTKILAFKLSLTLCYMAFLVAFYLLARARLPAAESLLITAFMAYNVAILRLQNQILADLPFLMWSTISLLLLECLRRVDPPRSTRTRIGVAAGLVILIAAMTRFNGFLLLIPAAAIHLTWLWRAGGRNAGGRRPLTTVVLPYLIVIVGYALYLWLLPSPGSGLADQWQSLSPGTLWSNLGYYLLLLPRDFLHDSLIGGFALYAVLMVFTCVGIALHPSRDAPLGLYALATIAVYVSFPLRQGYRYILPVLPVFFLLALLGMKDAVALLRPNLQKTARAMVCAFWACLAILSLSASVAAVNGNLAQDRREPSGPYSPQASRMFSFIRNATPEDSTIIFFKPRAMRLLTNRDSLMTTKCEDLPKGDYVVLLKNGGTNDQISPNVLPQCHPYVPVVRVFRAGDYEVYEIMKAPQQP